MPSDDFLFRITWQWGGPHEDGCGGPDPAFEEVVRGATETQVRDEFLAGCDASYLQRGWIHTVQVKKIGRAL